jgi:phage shock protein A
MWEFFKRFLSISKAKAHDKLDKIEDPAKILEDNIKELKKELAESMQGLAEIKALTIKTQRQVAQADALAQQQEKKAMIFLEKADKGEIDEAEADRLAAQALERKSQILALSQPDRKNLQSYQEMIAKIEDSIRLNRSQINQFEGELKSLKLRSRMSQTAQKLNKSLAGLDAAQSSALLEKIRDEVNQQEALAESYNAVLGMKDSIEKEVDKILGSNFSPQVSQDLKALKEKRRLAQSSAASKSEETSKSDTPPPTFNQNEHQASRFKIHRPEED